MSEKTFAIKSVYPSEQGLHLEHYTEAEAQAAYKDAKSRGINNVELDGLILTWKVYNPRSSHPIFIGREQKSNRGKLRLPQLLKLPGVAFGRRLSRARKAAHLRHFGK